MVRRHRIARSTLTGFNISFIRANVNDDERRHAPEIFFTICFYLLHFYHLKAEICYVFIVGLFYSLQCKTFELILADRFSEGGTAGASIQFYLDI